MGVAKETLVIFSSDNGGVFRPDRADTPQTQACQAGLKVNGSLKGGKHTVWEGGFKVPFVVRWPGQVAAASTCSQMISQADVLATTAAIVGEPLPAPDAGAEDSVSFLPALLGDPSQPVRESLVVHSADGVFAIRKGPWKWIEGEPVDEVKPGSRKVRADEYHAQLYDTQADPAETTDVAAAHPEVVADLKALLNLYRDGGYSRALPPADAKPEQKVAALPALTGQSLLAEPFLKVPGKPWSTAHGVWVAREAGVWGAQKGPPNQGASLAVPVAFKDGTVDYELCFDGAERHSLRFEWGQGDRAGSFRVVISRHALEITKNPSKGEGADKVDPLVLRRLSLEKRVWYPVRVTIQGDVVTVQVNETVVKASHAVVGEPKRGLTFLVFGDAAGFRSLRVLKTDAGLRP